MGELDEFRSIKLSEQYLAHSKCSICIIYNNNNYLTIPLILGIYMVFSFAKLQTMYICVQVASFLIDFVTEGWKDLGFGLFGLY